MRVTEYDRQLFDDVEVNDQLNDFFKESETPGSEWIISCCTFIHGKRNGMYGTAYRELLMIVLDKYANSTCLKRPVAYQVD